MRRIGVLAGYERPLPEHEAFRKQLQELGYVEGKNLVIFARAPHPPCRGVVTQVQRFQT